MIDKTAIIGKNVQIGKYVIIEKNVIIGDHVSIGNHVVIKEGTIISDEATIADHSILGIQPASFNYLARKTEEQMTPLIIGERTVIGSQCTIYRGTEIMNDVFIGDLASIREKVSIDEKSIIGRNVMVEHNTVIGKHVTVQTSSYVTADMVIEDHVFIGPCFSSSNDKYMGEGNFEHKGPILKEGAKIGNQASLLPGVTIGKEAVVGAGAVVTKDVADQSIVVGNPAKRLKQK